MSGLSGNNYRVATLTKGNINTCKVSELNN